MNLHNFIGQPIKWKFSYFVDKLFSNDHEFSIKMKFINSKQLIQVDTKNDVMTLCVKKQAKGLSPLKQTLRILNTPKQVPLSCLLNMGWPQEDGKLVENSSLNNFTTESTYGKIWKVSNRSDTISFHSGIQELLHENGLKLKFKLEFDEAQNKYYIKKTMEDYTWKICLQN